MDTKNVPFGHTVFVLLIHRRLELKELRPEAEQEVQKSVQLLKTALSTHGTGWETQLSVHPSGHILPYEIQSNSGISACFGESRRKLFVSNVTAIFSSVCLPRDIHKRHKS